MTSITIDYTPPPPIPVEIYEVIYDPPGQEPDDEMISLKNTGATAADISGWRLTDGEGNYSIPDGTILSPGGVWSVYGSTYNPTRNTRGLFLANSGDEVKLYDENGELVDSYSW